MKNNIPVLEEFFNFANMADKFLFADTGYHYGI